MKMSRVKIPLIVAASVLCGYFAGLFTYSKVWSHYAHKTNVDRYSEMMFIVHFMSGPLRNEDYPNYFSTDKSREEYRQRVKELAVMLDGRMDKNLMRELFLPMPSGDRFIKGYESDLAVILGKDGAK